MSRAQDSFDRRREVAERALLAMLAGPMALKASHLEIAVMAWETAEDFVCEGVGREAEWETNRAGATRPFADEVEL